MTRSLLNVMKAYMMRNSRSAFNWQGIGNNAHAGIGLFVRVARFLAGGMSSSIVLMIVSFVRYCYRIRRHEGVRGLALKLKASSMAIMKSVAGDSLTSTRALKAHVALTHGGLPTWLPVPVRHLIRSKHWFWIQMSLTLCNLYRVLDFRGKLSLKTIYSPGVEFDMKPFSDFVVIFFGKLATLAPEGFDFHQLPEFKALALLKSSPGTSAKTVIQTSVSALLRNVTVMNSSHLRPLLLEVLSIVKGPVRIFRLLAGLSQIAGRYFPIFTTSVMEEGRLGFKDEPGKVRVFAMVDWWTQMALRPLHLLVFSILKFIPQDGTFDQGRLVTQLQELIRAKIPLAHVQRDHDNQTVATGVAVFSFDLSAATDRLPLKVQVLLVNWLVPGLGPLWAQLLVDRIYSVGRCVLRTGTQVIPTMKVWGVKYAVGQPMGALSSWALLALTHHFMVQLAAHRCGHKGWFTDYGVLGDDLVIVDTAVANAYLEIARTLGVEINLAKSLVSNSGHFEFAKRFCSPFRNLSGVSLAEVTVAGGSLAAFKELLQRFSIAPTLGMVAAFLGKGPMACSRLMVPFARATKSTVGMLVWFLQPGVSKHSATSWSQWFNLRGIGMVSSRTNWLGILSELRAYVYDRVPAHEVALEDADLGALLFGEPFQDDLIFPSFPDVEANDSVLIDTVNELFAGGLEPSGYKTSFPFWAFEGGENVASRVDAGVDKVLQFLGENTPMEDYYMDPDAALGAFSIRKEDPVRLSVGQWLALWTRCSKVSSTPATPVNAGFSALDVIGPKVGADFGLGLFRETIQASDPLPRAAMFDPEVLESLGPGAPKAQDVLKAFKAMLDRRLEEEQNSQSDRAQEPTSPQKGEEGGKD